MLYLNIEKESKNSLTKQIYEQVRLKILNGDLKEGEKLASTRELSRILNISRNTVIMSYEMLISEGLVNSKTGSGLYVSPGAKYDRMPKQVLDYDMTAFSVKQLPKDSVNFHSGTPALDQFPFNKWLKAVSKAYREAPISALGYDYPTGRPEFRETLSIYLQKTRGISCHPDQILITTGSKQGLSLVAQCLLNPDKEAWIEDPSNINVRRIFQNYSKHIKPLSVDDKGIRTDLFPTQRTPALIFITPSHQFPMGGILPIQRRLELILYAREAGCYIIEDDYDSEFRYKGLPINSLRELENERVIYLDTFSKTLFPSIRLGYMVLPPALLEQFTEYKRLGDHHSNSLSQLAVMNFIDSGEMERHIVHMNKLYLKRRSYLISLLNDSFHDSVKILGDAAGIHIVAEFRDIIFTPGLINELEAAGVSVIPVEEHTIVKGRHTNQLILGYAHLKQDEMKIGVERLKKVLDSRKTDMLK